jgi:hypothetical protein
MLLEDILKEWDKDSHIDKNKLDTASLDVPKLHAKYIRILSHERMVLKKYEMDYKELKLDKLEFYVDGPTQEQVEKGWEIPAKGRILKSEVTPYLEADKDIIKLSLKIGMQQEKIEALKSIVDVISRLGFQIKNAIDFMRFMNGS